MYLTRTAQYALRLSLTQPAGPAAPVFRRNSVDRGTASAVVLATAGLSMSMFSLVQMQSSSTNHNRLRRVQ
ncbi:uncharacterized protein LOC100123925 [Nasonia vitripennis]|uniref:Uncharacterized protein n=2 Tax=Pteromalinae TaxID=272242 RepID=A0A7M7R219_NASVI|nr:uncharacterized protein LOC100123925 [Nasonia vitripennis]XP_031787281.1 uncharacterized protein LOC100123925 [Nasonia vitripennis]XP_032456147.1 uncharacterized protein LOC100123925 [Nasonia vitripennis]XP_032456148.1 uncharacterized protein LOC100123925 [Nasonia vitripennis]OXU24471.1 hypothetical protein TSAR_000253 [Trichomalopsis sarcophagae]